MAGRKKEIRLILLGKTGEGKSATGNTLLQSNKFFSALSGSSVTQTSDYGQVSAEYTRLMVVDTPGYFDTSIYSVCSEELDKKELIKNEILKSTVFTVPGPNALLHVIRLGTLTEENVKTADAILNNFGESVYKFIILVFTRVNDLHEGQSLQNYIDSMPPYFKAYLAKCGNRFIGIDNKNNTQEEKTKFREDLLELIDNLPMRNYTNATLLDATEQFFKRVETIQKDEGASYDEAKAAVLEDIKSEGGFFQHLASGSVGIAIAALVGYLLTLFTPAGPVVTAVIVAASGGATYKTVKSKCSIM